MTTDWGFVPSRFSTGSFDKKETSGCLLCTLRVNKEGRRENLIAGRGGVGGRGRWNSSDEGRIHVFLVVRIRKWIHDTMTGSALDGGTSPACGGQARKSKQARWGDLGSVVAEAPYPAGGVLV